MGDILQFPTARDKFELELDNGDNITVNKDFLGDRKAGDPVFYFVDADPIALSAIIVSIRPVREGE